MPIGPSNGSNRPESDGGNSAGVEKSSPYPLGDSTETPTQGNVVDNKEILSFQTKPANMSMSMKNENSDIK